MEDDLARLSEDLERGDGGAEFHPVIGGVAEACGEFLAVAAGDKDGSVTARPRVPFAPSVGMYDDAVQGGGFSRGTLPKQAKRATEGVLVDLILFALFRLEETGSTEISEFALRRRIV
jgi:hypothetical protein